MIKILLLLMVLSIAGCGNVARDVVEKSLQWNEVDSCHMANDMYLSFQGFKPIGDDINSIETYISIGGDVNIAELVSLKTAFESRKQEYFSKLGRGLGIDTKVYVSIVVIDDVVSHRRYFTVSGNWIDGRNGGQLKGYIRLVRKDRFVTR